MDRTAVRSLTDVTRAMSAKRAELTPEPRPDSTHTTDQSVQTKTLNLTAKDAGTIKPVRANKVNKINSNESQYDKCMM